MEVYKEAISVNYKPDCSPLTDADLNANRIIVKALKHFYPGIPILSEEAIEDFKGVNKEGFYWLIDPLDGTKEFIRRNGEFTVNIALIQNGEPILGFVFAPQKKLMYHAFKCYGAFKQEGDTDSQVIKVNPRLDYAPWKVVGSRSHESDTFKLWLSNIEESEIILMGSSLKICLIAEGGAHVYPRFGPTSFWDIAAAHIILKEAGGCIRDFEGQELKYVNVMQPLNPYFIASYNNNDYFSKPLKN
jgi:3'(2'), 5'-bisphosphate nucleotidase